MAEHVKVDWEPLPGSSTGAQQFAYDADSATLLIQFEGAKFMGESVYEYSPVSSEEAQALRTASSVGRFIHYFLKDRGRRIR